MTSDDVLAYLAATPKAQRPTELRSAGAMLTAWLRLRKNRHFAKDVLERHGLHGEAEIDMEDETHKHAIGNAWGYAVEAWIENPKM